MGHYKKVGGKLKYAKACFKESGTAMQSMKPSDLSPGDAIKMSGKNTTYLGSTQHDPKDDNTIVHHFQNDSSGVYNSYPTNSVPAMQSRDAMESGDNSGAGTSADA